MNDGTYGYLITIATNTVSQITDTDFPNGVKQAGYTDGYFMVTGNGSQQFYISSLLDGATWDGLDFASAEGSPDNTVGLVINHREVWLFGSNSAEIWVDTGSASFPFERTGNAFIEYGCSSALTIAKLADTVFWLGGGDIASGIVYMANGYTPNRVSTNAVEFAILSYGDLSTAFATTYQQEGHTFYCLTFPSAGKTWCYDVSSTLWHERDYTSPTTGISTQWRPVVLSRLTASI